MCSSRRMSKTNDASFDLIQTGTETETETEIIDVSSFDFDDINAWLYVPAQCQSESTVDDLYTWLNSEPELVSPVNRKSIDTRTFTRPKKRSSRNYFESISDNLPSSISKAWKASCSIFSNIEEDLKYSVVSTANKEEVPLMLKTVCAAVTNNLSDETAMSSGQESMEVFLKMSHSKGSDSFIDLVEPGPSDPLMNISKPSIFYSSVSSLPRDDSLLGSDGDKESEPANLTHFLHYDAKNDKNADSKNSNGNNTFSKVDETDNSRSYCITPANRTFTSKPEVIEPAELNETYNAAAMSTTPVLSGSDKQKCSTSTLSSTFVNKDDENKKFLQVENKEKQTFVLNSTYVSTSQNEDESFNLNATYCATEIEQPNKDVTIIYKDKSEPSEPLNNTIYSVPFTVQANSSFAFLTDNTFDCTFKSPIPLCKQSTPKNMDALNNTFQITKHLDQNRIHSTGLSGYFKGPTSLRRELLAEIYRSGERKLDSTYNHISNEHHNEKHSKEVAEEMSNQTIKCDISTENKYNTYKKESPVNKTKPQIDVTNEAGAGVQNSSDRKYYTFTKKSNIHGGRTDIENAESLENVDTTFVKPLPKLQKRKQHIPRMLSKLPQFLQKSNPNLVSGSLKTVNMAGTNVSGNGFMKGSQPNIIRDVEKTLTNKLYSLGKIKSGSEQRLLELNSTVGELQIMGAGGSTESIESTQSAHSAPDLDDRLSTCSDSSHNSYTVRPMNIDQLHQIVRMQEESLKQGTTPQLNRRLLDNTWVDGQKDLLSPITKNGVDSSEGNVLSPLTMDFTVKTSSPILSPTKSSQSINTDGQPSENTAKQNETVILKKVEALNKPTMKFENKTRLRQPTNWNTGCRPPNMMSAIPRPPSRIPAPRFVRPVTRNMQDDVKKG